jgi:DMSO/TMAO reductase YedYZ molybdopterin-dependent catalytic subunit
MDDQQRVETSRRAFLQTAGMLLTGGAAFGPAFAARAASSIVLPFENGERPLVAYPQKRPLIRHTARPPQLETPFRAFREGILTPNDAFFVRYHLANIPTFVNAAAFRLSVRGLVRTPLSLSLGELQTGFTATEIVAVAQCSGNSRGFVSPRVAGGQMGNGAMGNARWRGVPLKAILDRAGVKAGATQVTFQGLDTPALPATPDFVKALPLDHARSDEVLVAYAMNGADLPMLNGYPIRLVVPGYFGTYWVKHLSDIEVVDREFDGFFMAKAYRIPATDCACVAPGTAAQATRSIGRMPVRSFITSHEDGDSIPAKRAFVLRGIAFDGGSGIAAVAVSADDGRSWQAAKLGEDLGVYSFRPWEAALTLPKPGAHSLKVRATSRSGETQPLTALWNPAGYQRNVVESMKVKAV